MTNRGLFKRPVWKDPLFWLWLLALPVSFQATYWWEENVGNGVDSGRAWAVQILGVWLGVTVVLVLIALARRALRGRSA